MSPRNLKRERFALELYAGKHATEAYVIAGYEAGKTSLPHNARRLARDPDIKRRIEKMFAEERGYAEIEAARCRRERRIIAFSDVANYFEPSLDPEGKPTGKVRIKDFTKLPRELTAALKSIRPTKLGWEIALHDKDSSLRAIEERVDPKPDASAPGVAVQVNVANQLNGETNTVNGPRERIAGRLEKIAGNEAGDTATE
jgi:hypothetical protein